MPFYLTRHNRNQKPKSNLKLRARDPSSIPDFLIESALLFVIDPHEPPVRLRRTATEKGDE
jgi:hypothetical protein